MGFLSDLIDKAKSLIEDPPQPTQRRALKSDSFDQRDWDDLRDKVPTIQTEMDEVGKTTDYVEDFFGDLHSLFHKVHPDLRPSQEMAQTHVPNRAVTETLMGMQEVAHLRQHSVGDGYGTAMAMLAVKEDVKSTVEEVRKATAEAEQARADAQQRRKEAQEALQKALDEAQANPPAEDDEEAQQGLGDVLSGLMGQVDRAGADAQAAQQQVQQQIEQAGPMVQARVRKAAEQADKDLSEEEALASAFGYEPGELKRMDIQERMDLAQRLRSNPLAKFVNIIGQFKMVQQANSRKRVTNAAEEIAGVTLSNDLANMVAGELLNFADPSLETLMLTRWTEHQLNTYLLEGKEKLGQGPIIVVADESGSMTVQDMGGASREAWAKGLSLAMLDQAKRRKRDFIYIGFSWAQSQRVIRFPHGEAGRDKVIELTETLLNGGTSYPEPLNMALDIIEKEFDRDEKGRPDIVFITDDTGGSLSPEFMENWNRVKDKTSIQCYGIAVGCDVGTALNQVSDNVRSIVDLTADPRNVGDLFRTI